MHYYLIVLAILLKHCTNIISYIVLTIYNSHFIINPKARTREWK